MADIFDMADTWNNAGTTFTAIKMNVTDTASNAASLLMDLQVGGSSRFSIDKNGRFTIPNAGGAAIAAGQYGITLGGSVWFQDGFRLVSSGELRWSNGTTQGSATDLVLTRDAANTLAQRNGANAQLFRVYQAFTDGSNYSRFEAVTGAAETYLRTISAGTGTASAMDLVVRANTGKALYLDGDTIAFRTALAVGRWSINSSGHFVAATDNTYDIGASGANRPRDIYIARDIYSAGGTQAIFRTASAITSGAGANTGTLTNAPAAGNPTKWIPINDNGTTRYIPAW